MEWNKIKKIIKFTPMEQVFNEFEKPEFIFIDRPMYYMGEGFFLSYSEKCFKVENNMRVEYGESNKYLVTLYYFENFYESSKILNLDINKYKSALEYDSKHKSFEIVHGIQIGDSYRKISHILSKVQAEYYNQGETRAYNKDKSSFEFQNKWIQYDNFELFFFGKFANTKLSGFKYCFRENLNL